MPSKKIIDSYVYDLNPLAKATKLNFRDKSRYGWEYSCVFEVDYDDGKKHYGRSSTDLFYIGFLNELFLRESCYKCPYVGRSRVGDITLADYWRVNIEDVPELTNEDIQLGVSLVLINDNKGQKAIDNLKGDYTIIIIAHRLSTIVNCHKIFILDKGKIVDSGSHIELLKKNKNYKHLCETELVEK